MKSKARRIFTFIFAAIHLLANIVYSAAYAAGGVQPIPKSKSNTSSVPAATSSKRAASATPAPTGRKAYYEAEKQATGDIAGILSKIKMTPAQRIAVRNYIGQAQGGVKIVGSGNVGKVVTFAIKNAKTGAFLGRIGITVEADGAVIVNKATAADLDYTKTVSVPIAGKFDASQTRQTLNGSEQLLLVEANLKKPSHTASLPGLTAARGIDFANARQCSARFNLDGSGSEYCLVSKPTQTPKLAATPAPGKGTSKSAPAAKGRPAPGSRATDAAVMAATGVVLEGFVNYFSRPTVDKGGRMTHAVVGGHYTLNTTMTQVQKQGSTSTASVNFTPTMNVPVQPEVGIPEGGDEAPEAEQPEAVSGDETARGDERQSQTDEESAPTEQGQQGQAQDQQQEQEQQDEDQPADEQGGDDQAGDDTADDEDCGGKGIPGLPGIYVGGPSCDEPNALQQDMEERDYENAVQDGSPQALETYLKEHPDSEQAGDVLNLLELGAAGETAIDFDNRNAPENTTPSEDTPYN
jgi:hypothetical protein